MNNFKQYILEKLRINKDLKIGLKDINENDNVLIISAPNGRFVKDKILNLYIGKVIGFEKWRDDSMIRIDYVEPFIKNGGPVIFRMVKNEIYDAIAGDNSMLINKVKGKELLENAIKTNEYNIINDEEYKDYTLFGKVGKNKVKNIDSLLKKIIDVYLD